MTHNTQDQRLATADETTPQAASRVRCIRWLCQMTDTAGMMKTTLGMSNFDHSIDDGLEEELRANEGEMWGGHAGWNFHGRVFFLRGVWHEEVWQYGTKVETVTAETLRELMDAVCDKYGYE